MLRPCDRIQIEARAAASAASTVAAAARRVRWIRRATRRSTSDMPLKINYGISITRSFMERLRQPEVAQREHEHRRVRNPDSGRGIQSATTEVLMSLSHG